jgi:hypothetical protein
VVYPKIIGADGPKMLALSSEIADGAIPAMVPPEFTAQARHLLGPGKLLVVGLAVVADADPDQAKATARLTVAGRLGQPGTYAATMARLGYSEREITEVTGSCTTPASSSPTATPTACAKPEPKEEPP